MLLLVQFKILQDQPLGHLGLFGGGASGAIYSAFSLNPIPNILETAAIFNSTNDPDGMRILHTHSPTLSGDPDNLDDFMGVIRTLANTYVNAIIAFSNEKFESW